jgi:hypothetical protein
MHWNEKIDLIKRHYSEEEFSVPHVDRKAILKKIESKFITRTPDYYDLNNHNTSFCTWWDHLNATSIQTLEIKPDLRTILNTLIHPNQHYWFACEFIDGVLIYKAKKESIIELISIGQTWTKTFHLIALKYDSLLSVKLDMTQLALKTNGNIEIEP